MREEAEREGGDDAQHEEQDHRSLAVHQRRDRGDRRHLLPSPPSSQLARRRRRRRRWRLTVEEARRILHGRRRTRGRRRGKNSRDFSPPSTSSFCHRGVFLVVEEGGRHLAEALRGNSTWRISIRWHGHAVVLAPPPSASEPHRPREETKPLNCQIFDRLQRASHPM